ncbi:MAG: putative motility protein [Rubrivivax sp.]|nr:MAG: putative motility protein [Rubrivivax sp.]
MNIANNAGVGAATSAAQDPTAGAAQMLLLKKALDSQAAVAASLIQAIPQPPLATEGLVGRNLNTLA